MRIVVSQPMYFPWVGLFEQIALADVFVFYTDVQFSKGSFTNRVQIKTRSGSTWLTVPLHNLRLGQSINDVLVEPGRRWQDRHVSLLQDALSGADFYDDAYDLMRRVFSSCDHTTIADVASASLRVVCEYFGLDRNKKFLSIDELAVKGQGSQRVLNIVKTLGGERYITGHGAQHYLDHEAFEKEGVLVEYMDYQCAPYPQFHGQFTPYVSVLDLVAHCGRNGASAIRSGTIDWRNFFDRKKMLSEHNT